MSDQPSMLEMVRQARDLQKKMKKVEKRVGKTELTASAGDAMPRWSPDGQLIAFMSNSRSPGWDVARGNVRAIEVLVVQAVNAAIRKAQDLMAEEMKQVTGGMSLPGL